MSGPLPPAAIALAQQNLSVGDLRENAYKLLSACQEAKSKGSTLVISSELGLCGYPPRDLLNIEAFIDLCYEQAQRVIDELPEGIVLVFGAPRRRPEQLDGRPLYNCALVASKGKLLAEIPKALLPDYDVFDEGRYFHPAPHNAPRVFEHAGVTVGVTICEDMWNDRLLWERRRYRRDPVAEAVEQGAEVIINLSASPFNQGKHLMRRKLVCHAAERWSRPVYYCNGVGAQDGLIFDGGSLAANEHGEVIGELPWFEPEITPVDAATLSPGRKIKRLEALAEALALGIQDYAQKANMKKWVLGVSGGIDSALVAALASLALGPENGRGIAMPSRYSSEHSIADARGLCRNLGIPFSIIPIEPAHQAYETMLGPLFAELGAAPEGDVTAENLQARARGATLMAYANRTGALLLTTGNKSECSVGYCTLYGDTCGGLAVIADLWKLEVYELCRYLNRTLTPKAIPESTLTKPPSAELAPGQQDDQSLPPYEVLDPILQALVEEELGVTGAAAATGQPRELVAAMARKLYLAEYKRKQFAPTLRVNARAWTGRDYPIANGYRGH